MLFLLIITPIVHFLLAKTKFTITRIIIVLLQEIIQTMIWKRIYANRTKWFSYFLILESAIPHKSPNCFCVSPFCFRISFILVPVGIASPSFQMIITYKFLKVQIENNLF